MPELHQASLAINYNWHYVSWSNEMKPFSLGTASKEQHMKATVEYGSGVLMRWRCFVAGGFVKIDGIIND